MVYGLIHTAVILVVLVLFFRTRPSHARTPRPPWSFMLARLVQLRRHRDDGRDPAAALRRARGADDVRHPVVLLLVSGVYYPIDVLPEWMQVLSHLSPATYVLDGVRAGLIDGVPVTALWYDVVPLHRDGRRAHPGRRLGVRPGRAVRQAHRQAQAGRLRWTSR